MFSEILLEIWENHRGRCIGVLAGVAIGLMFILLGFFKAVFLLVCIGIGYFLGNKVDNNEDLMDLLDRILPPGYHK